MLLEIQLRKISLKPFQQLHFEDKDTAALFAGQIALTIPAFKTQKDASNSNAMDYGVKFEFTTHANDGYADLTLSMELNGAASVSDIKDMERVTCAALKFKPEDVTISTPSLRKE